MQTQNDDEKIKFQMKLFIDLHNDTPFHEGLRRQHHLKQCPKYINHNFLLVYRLNF